MTESDSKIKIFGTRGSAGTYAIRDFLYRCGVPFEYVEFTSNEGARALENLNGINDQRLPVCVFPDGTKLERPTVRQVTEKLGWFRNPSRAEYDLSIYGAGPAGLSAAVYGASEGLKTVLVERYAWAGRRGRVRKSRTIWDSRTVSAEGTWRTALANRQPASGLRSCCFAKECAANFCRAKELFTSRMEPRSSPAPPSVLPAWITGD